MALVALLAFAPCLQNGFTNWDDDIYLTANEDVRSGTWPAAARVFTSYLSGNYHPLPLLTYAAEHRLFGLAPVVYHATNVVLHAANSALAFAVFLGLGLTEIPSAIGALLFALHPMKAEPVAWVTGRKDLLSALFLLGSLLTYLRYRSRPKPQRYVASLFLFLLCLLSKATGAVLPLLLLVVDWGTRRKIDRRALLEKAPYAALAALFTVVAVAARTSYQSVLQEGGVGLVHRVLTAAYRLSIYYTARTVAPLPHLAGPYLPPGSIPWAVGAVAAVAAALVAATAAARRSRAPAAGLLFWTLALCPALSLPVVGYSADRFAYVPSLGLAFLGACAVQWGERRGRDGRARLALLAGAVGALLGLVVATQDRCRVWRDSVSLWTDAIALYPESGGDPANAAIALVYRGRAYRDGGDAGRALADLTAAVQADPSSAEAHTELGITRASLGQSQEALADFTQAVAAGPRYAAAYTQRGMVRFRLGDIDGAVADLSAALALNPRDAEAYNERGIALAAGGRLPEAIADFSRAVELAPGATESLVNRGLARLAGGDADGAVLDFTQAIDLAPFEPAGYLGRAEALKKKGDPAAASRDLAAGQELLGAQDRGRSSAAGRSPAP